jgi:cbb3-type cytochrome c oxidase subunit III
MRVWLGSSGALVLAVFVCGTWVAAGAPQSPTAPRRGGNPEAAKIMNPVGVTPESVAAGRRVYTQFCANCHGPSGKGDGTSAGAQPPSLADAMWDYGSSDGEMFSVIRDGTSGDMGAYGERLKETDIWNVVNLVKSLGQTQK